MPFLSETTRHGYFIEIFNVGDGRGELFWGETVLTCKRRYNRGRVTRSCWWAHCGVEIGRDGHINGHTYFFFRRVKGAEARIFSHTLFTSPLLGHVCGQTS